MTYKETIIRKLKERYGELEESKSKSRAESNLDELVVTSRMNGILEAINIALDAKEE